MICFLSEHICLNGLMLMEDIQCQHRWQSLWILEFSEKQLHNLMIWGDLLLVLCVYGVAKEIAACPSYTKSCVRFGGSC